MEGVACFESRTVDGELATWGWETAESLLHERLGKECRVELESWEWRVANHILNECVRGECRRRTPESVFAYLRLSMRTKDQKRAGV